MRKLVAKSGVSLPSVTRIEGGERPNPAFTRLVRVAAEDRDDVLSAETEAVVHRVPDVGAPRFVGHEVEIAGRIRVLVVNCRR